jgi:DNA-binding CsgD family transcriptional regulator
VATAEVERGREAYARRAWKEAHEALLRADADEPLGAEDLELLAVAAYLLARDDECAAVSERAHHAFLEQGDTRRAIRSAFWLGMVLVFKGEVAPGSGWLTRAQRLLDKEGEDCAERGYLLIPLVFRHEQEGEWEAAAEVARQAAEIGERFDDADLFAMATRERGHILATHGRLAEGLTLLDEAMVAATSRAESPIVVGIVYCGVILACVETFEVRRAQEWTDVLARWCDEQPDLVAFTGRCRIHRAEILQLKGAWSEALAEARLAEERLVRGFNRSATAQAFYRQAELRRLRGELEAAERAYEAAGRHGFEPQPGLALLRVAQGRGDAAVAAIRRALAEATDGARRAALLPAAVEVMLSLDEVEAALDASRELRAIADEYGSALLGAAALHAEGAASLHEGDTAAALAALRQAWTAWSALDAPYEAARARVLVGLACRGLGDEDGARLELEGARETFALLGAAPDVEHVESLLGVQAAERDTHGLTKRELEVLRLVASGKSNRAIAAELVISEHTVARHVQNIFAKLGVSSRTAAASFAFAHALV